MTSLLELVVSVSVNASRTGSEKNISLKVIGCSLEFSDCVLELPSCTARLQADMQLKLKCPPEGALNNSIRRHSFTMNNPSHAIRSALLGLL